jgi:predicted HAD superfamily Cof-like phosphohydrolase
MGADAEGAWKEVMRSNFAKIGDDGKVRKREDGKVLKPVGWTPPDLKPFVDKETSILKQGFEQ